MEQSPLWEANGSSASRNFARFIEPKAYRRFHNNPPHFTTLSEINPVHIPSGYREYAFEYYRPI